MIIPMIVLSMDIKVIILYYAIIYFSSQAY